jgi:hypothetical protein
MAFVRAVRAIEHHIVVSSGTFADEDQDKRAWESMKRALKTLVEATQSYMVAVILESHFRCSN